ncbi:aminopeptidase [[Eubacterium] cellulosolvens]
MVSLLDFELVKAADLLVGELVRIKPSDHVLVYADSESDWRVAETTATAAHNAGAKVAVMRYPTPRGVGENADADLPEPLVAAMRSCDVMIEFSNKYLLYSTPWQAAMQGKRARYLCLSGVTSEMLVRCVGGVNVQALIQFQDTIARLTRNATRMRITTPSGGDIEFQNDPKRPVFTEGVVAEKPGDYMLIGQVDWAPIESSLKGTIVFDGSVWPPEDLGLLANPIRLKVDRGKVVSIDGGREARTLERWLDSFDDPAMRNVAHISYGCNPGAKLSGRIIEDERVWGSVEWGLGYQGEGFLGAAGPAKTHTDGICLNASIWMNGEQISSEGTYTHPELAALSKRVARM